MKKLFFLFVLCAFFSSTFSQNISTGVANWTINGGNAAQAIALPHPNWARCMATPVPQTGARWVSPTGSINVTAGVYNFETVIPVSNANSSLRLNFSATADDYLQALELIDPSGTIIPMKVPPALPCFYALRAPTDTTVGCAQQGNWRLRARVQFVDAIGGFILSGLASVGTGNCCSCGQWNNSTITTKCFQKTLSCGQTLILGKTSPVTVFPDFKCSNGCKTLFSAALTLPNGQTQRFDNAPISFTPMLDGQYRLLITPRCGEQNCAPCAMNFITSPGCPGEIFPARRLEANVTELASFAVTQPEQETLFSININAPDKTLDMPNGNYLVKQNKEGLLLVDARSGSVFEKYQRIPYTPQMDWEQEEEEQWRYFRENIYPGLLKRANETCKPVGYCLGISHNGKPSAYYAMMISPTDPRCIRVTTSGFFPPSYYNVQNFSLQEQNIKANN